MNTRRLILNWRSIAVFALIFIFGYWFSLGYFTNQNHIEASAHLPAPNISLERLDGGSASLEDYRGQWVLINFWATWCYPCVLEMPSLEKFYQKLKEKNLTVLAVSLDKGPPEKVRDFVKDMRLTFEIFRDPESVAASRFGVSGLPATFFINPEGEIVAHALGGRDWADPVILDYFSKLMGEV